ncbi:MAG: hypothetical protein HZA54_08465 [Planctomycetes bacterium]|nr:hypothetical protein [Planctomycetota bacterium]
MPGTVNGCGTRYLGKRNCSMLGDVCSICGQAATLNSYDTRLWVVVLFIPLIPLRRYRVCRECSVCRRHFAIPVAAFEKGLADEIAPLVKGAAPGERAVRLELARARCRFERIDDACGDLQGLVKEAPEDAEARWLHGKVDEMQGRMSTAGKMYEEAHRLAPVLDKYLEAMAYNAAWQGRHADAEKFFRELLTRDATQVEWLAELARLQEAQRRMPDAAATWDRIFALRPDLQRSPAAVAASLQARRAAGRDVAADEKLLAARSVKRPGAWRRWLAFAAATLLLAAGVALLADRSARVLLVNTTGEQVRYTLDGRPWTELPPYLFAFHRLGRGRHVVEAVGARGEPARVEVEATPSLAENVFGTATGVCDPFGLAVYREVTAIYGVGQATTSVLHAGERWFQLPALDHLFEPPPQSVYMKAGESRRRVALMQDWNLDPAAVAGWLAQSGRPREAIAYLQNWLPWRPLTFSIPSALLDLARRNGRLEEVRDWAGARRGTAPATTVYHRLYQDAVRAAGGEGALAALAQEYGDSLKAHPGAAPALYLNARLEPGGSAEALRLADAALAADATFEFARLARAGSLWCGGRYDAAAEEYAQVAARNPTENEVRVRYWGALATARAWARLDAALADGVAQVEPMALTIASRLLAWRDGDRAAWEEWERTLAPRFGAPGQEGLAWRLERRLEAALWRGGADDLVEAEQRLQELAALGDLTLVVRWRLGWCLEVLRGRWSEAERRLTAGPTARAEPGLSPEDALLFATACAWNGRRGEVKTWRERALRAASRRGLDALFERLERGGAAGGRAAEAGVESAAAQDQVPEAQALVVRAFCAGEPAERARLLDLAERLSAFQMDSAVFLIRGLFRRAPPRR